MPVARLCRRAAAATLAVALLGLAGACGPAAQPESASSQQRPLLFVSILPQQYLVQRLGGDRLAVSVLVGPGHSPATYEPTPKQMAELQHADCFISIGVPFEQHLLDKVAEIMPRLPIIDGRRGIELQPMAESGYGAESAGDDHPGTGVEEHAGHHHDPGQPDPHFWLDPLLVITHVNSVAEALAERYTADAALVTEIERNRQTLIADLQAVHERMAARLTPLSGRRLYVYHPAYGYLARRYGLVQVAVEREGKEPSARQLGGLIDQAKQDGATAVFVQPQLSERSARVVAEAIGTQVVILDPLAPDYLDNLERMAERIAGALAP